MTSLLDLINAVRADAGKPELHGPTRYLPPRLPRTEALTMPPSGDLHACGTCGWPVWTVEGREGLFDDLASRRRHGCHLPEKRLMSGSVLASAPGSPAAVGEPPAKASAPSRGDSPLNRAPSRPTPGGIAI